MKSDGSLVYFIIEFSSILHAQPCFASSLRSLVSFPFHSSFYFLFFVLLLKTPTIGLLCHLTLFYSAAASVSPLLSLLTSATTIFQSKSHLTLILLSSNSSFYLFLWVYIFSFFTNIHGSKT